MSDLSEELKGEKKFLVRAYDSTNQLENEANRLWPTYRLTSISDTNSYISGLFERVDGDE